MVESLVTSLDSVDKEKTTKVSSLVKELLDTKKAIDSAEDHLKSLKKKAESISSICISVIKLGICSEDIDSAFFFKDFK